MGSSGRSVGACGSSSMSGAVYVALAMSESGLHVSVSLVDLFTE